MKIVEGIFDGTAVRPLETVDWQPNQKVSILVGENFKSPVMEIFGKISHEHAEEIRKNRVNFGVD